MMIALLFLSSFFSFSFCVYHGPTIFSFPFIYRLVFNSFSFQYQPTGARTQRISSRRLQLSLLDPGQCFSSLSTSRYSPVLSAFALFSLSGSPLLLILSDWATTERVGHASRRDFQPKRHTNGHRQDRRTPAGMPRILSPPI